MMQSASNLSIAICKQSTTTYCLVPVTPWPCYSLHNKVQAKMSCFVNLSTAMQGAASRAVLTLCLACSRHADTCRLPGVNVADFILDLAMGEVPGCSGLSGHDAIRAVYRSYEQFAITADDGFHDSTQLQELRLVQGKKEDDAADNAAGAKSSTFSGVSGMFQRLKSHGMAAGSGADAEAPVVVASSGAEFSAGKAVERVKDWGGLGNRGGASYTTQLLALLSRCIKVSRCRQSMHVSWPFAAATVLVLRPCLICILTWLPLLCNVRCGASSHSAFIR